MKREAGSPWQRAQPKSLTMNGGYIPGTGRYRLLATENAKGQFEWTHFTERDNGYRDHFMRGWVQHRQELEQLIALINQTLQAVYGEAAMMKEVLTVPLPSSGRERGERLV